MYALSNFKNCVRTQSVWKGLTFRYHLNLKKVVTKYHDYYEAPTDNTLEEFVYFIVAICIFLSGNAIWSFAQLLLPKKHSKHQISSFNIYTNTKYNIQISKNQKKLHLCDKTIKKYIKRREYFVTYRSTLVRKTAFC